MANAAPIPRWSKQRGWRVARVLLALAAVSAACSDNDAPPTDGAALAVGPAPLRRLSNDEYVNALTDLFPTVAIQMPPLPDDSDVANFNNAAEAQKPSDLRVARYEEVANLYSAALTKDAASVTQLVGCDYSNASSATDCAAQFIRTTGRRVYRRPLLAEEQDRLVVRFAGWSAAIDFAAAVQLTLSTFLQSPQFLYRPEPTDGSGPGASQAVVPLSSMAIATRLAIFLWESVPDDGLLAAAERNELSNPAQVEAQAKRMLADPRARRVYWSFHRQWLGLSRIVQTEHAERIAAVDPNWTPALQTAALREAQLTTQNVIADGGGLRDLWLTKRSFVNADLARVYGITTPASGAFAEVQLPAGERAGLLTRVAFLAGYSHRNGTSPPLRGSGVITHALCQTIGAPPPGADLSQPMPAPDDTPKTNRQLFEERTAPAVCAGCHAQLNGIGFGFEHYNAAGIYQTSERGLPINARGALLGADDSSPFNGALELSERLARSKNVYACATEQWMRYAFGRAPDKKESAWLASATNDFFASGGNVQQLLLRIVASPSFRFAPVEAPVTPNKAGSVR
jgi:Protein of unknown function (DUF1592)/Protein of unknown function (DUF1588)/Protein of unknown function (DUF1595)/Protein of unknown function (DUF1585)/Protein of unknown function (DUF1587)